MGCKEGRNASNTERCTWAAGRLDRRSSSGKLFLEDAHGPVDDLHDDVGRRDGLLRLAHDLRAERVRQRLLPAARVDDHELAPVPAGDVFGAVAGHAGGVVNQGMTFADQPVEQGLLADIGTADDRDLERHSGFIASFSSPRHHRQA